jgi:translocation protein SEC66
MQANALAPNWGQTIFQSANEIAANTALKKRLDEIQAQTEAEKDWWEKRRAGISSELMKELDEADKTHTKAGSEDEPVLVDTNPPSAASSGGSKKKKGKK